jgi:formylglycine-generating enzyme
MVLLEGGEFLMGNVTPSAYPGDGEGPLRRIRLDPFWIDRSALSNAEFAAFVEDTGHVTEAERFGWSFVFAGLLRDDSRLRGGWRTRPGGARWKGRTGAARRVRSRSSTGGRTIRSCT